MATIGTYLKRERELRGISLEEIARATKINIRLLEALESDDLSSLPPPVFVKGFVRSYAQYIGLDPDDAVLRYEDYLEREREEVRAVEEGRERRGLLKAVVIGGLLLMALLVVFLVSLLKEAEKPPPEEAPKGHVLQLKAVEPTWIKVVIDGKDIEETLLKPGEEAKWTAKKGFFIVIGNAGGVRIFFDGKDLGVPGESGKVIRISLPEDSN